MDSRQERSLPYQRNVCPASIAVRVENVHLLWNFLETKSLLSYSVSQTKWRTTTEAENSARGSAFRAKEQALPLTYPKIPPGDGAFSCIRSD